MESLTYVNEIDIQKVKKGQKVIVGLDAVKGKVLDGTVTSVANIGEQRPNSDSKVYEVIIEIAATDSLLRPAMTTSNEIQVDRLADAISIPLEAIHAQDSLSFVFLKNGLTTTMQQVELGLINENEAVIHKGISITDRLFLSMPEDTSEVTKSYLKEDNIIANN
jgi:multidrug efflux pump subunit AcrA (membrane-fusion protein)